MNYCAYIKRRIGEIAYLKSKLRKLFSFLQDGDYDKLQALLIEVESILKKYDENSA